MIIAGKIAGFLVSGRSIVKSDIQTGQYIIGKIVL